MTEFTIKLAGVPIHVQCLFDTTRNYCKDYLTEDTARIDLTITQSEIEAERVHSAKQMALEGHGVTHYADSYMEKLALYRRIADALLPHQVLLFHGCVVAYDGKAYVFTAKSGTGKTTHSRLWLDNIPGCHILNGDKPLLLFRDNKVFACGTPWQGKEAMGTNEILPIGGLCILSRGAENRISPITFSEAFPVLVAQSQKAQSVSLTETMNLIAMFSALPLYRLSCNMDKEAAMVSFRGMVGKEPEA